MIQSKPRELPFTEQIFSILMNHSFNQHYIAMGIFFWGGGGELLLWGVVNGLFFFLRSKWLVSVFL